MALRNWFQSFRDRLHWYSLSLSLAVSGGGGDGLV